MSEGRAAFVGLVDLASATLGGRALATSDEFFAEAANLVKPRPAVFDPTTYTDRGKEMDGWESRRRRTPGHDWTILELGLPGRIRAVDIDTAHFLGNHAPYASLDGCYAPGADAEWLRDHAVWTPVVPETPMQRGSQNLCASVSDRVFSHVRLNIYPDGGVARLRVYGDPEVEVPDGRFDLACMSNGGRAVACSDAFFSPMEQLIHPGRSTYMGGGWETRRSRPPAEDWIVVQLAGIGTVERVELETHHFKGNFPDRIAVDGILWPGATPTGLRDSPDWEPLVTECVVRADAEHAWKVASGPFSHVRLRIFPDGGVSRLRVFGRLEESSVQDIDPDEEGLIRCCGSERWVAQMLAAAPFLSRAHLFGTAERLWWHLDQADWIQAFEAHPKIGAKKAGGWSASEQAGVAGAEQAVLDELAEQNAAYEERYGYIFIVCASGLSAAEMLDRLKARIDNTPENELRIAAGEQAKITRLRLQKLLET